MVQGVPAKWRVWSWLVSITAAVGVLLQALQPDDPTPILYYFTVWSALGVMVTMAIAGCSQPRTPRFFARAFAIGTVASAFIYLAVLAPMNGWGQSWLTVTANVVLHVILPLVVIVWNLLLPERRPPIMLDMLTIILPIVYFVLTVLAQAVGEFRSPYGFLRPDSDVSAPAVVSGFALLWLVLVFLFRLLGRRLTVQPPA